MQEKVYDIIRQNKNSRRCTKIIGIFCKKCLTFLNRGGIVNKLSRGIASKILNNKFVFRIFKLTVDNRLNLW